LHTIADIMIFLYTLSLWTSRPSTLSPLSPQSLSVSSLNNINNKLSGACMVPVSHLLSKTHILPRRPDKHPFYPTYAVKYARSNSGVKVRRSRRSTIRATSAAKEEEHYIQSVHPILYSDAYEKAVIYIGAVNSCNRVASNITIPV
jgi:hypothetical protein